MVLDLDPAGIYTPKEGYIKLSTEVDPREEVWWWRPLWKLKCPAKTKLFMWYVLENRVPTWDTLQKRNFQGPGWCVLCKREQESITHLFLSCSYSVEVWKESSTFLGFPCRWERASMGIAWESWWRMTP